jgi:predicted outer membrane repeat protein
MLLLVLLLAVAWCCYGAPCNPKSQSFVISNAKSARDFTAAAACTNGKLTAEWRVSLTLKAPIVVGQGTQLSIEGPRENTVMISGDGSIQLFIVKTGAALELDSLTLSKGRSKALASGGGAVFLDVSSFFTASRVRFEENFSAGTGGAILALAQSVVALERCMFSNNTANEGGACYFIEVSATLSSTLVANNRAQRGGGILQTGGSVIITNSELLNNTAAALGGAISQTFESSLIVSGSHFTGNTASSGGALYKFTGRSTLLECTFSSNAALASTPGRQSDRTSVLLAPGCGGALALKSGTTNITSCSFADNSAVASGGGLCCSECTVTATGCSFEHNSAADTGGAVAVPYYDPLAQQPFRRLLPVTDDVTVLQLRQLQLQTQAALRLTRCTLAGNAAATGGALYTAGNSVLDSCVFSDNIASVSGGAEFYATGAVDTPTVAVMNNSIYSNNSAATAGASYLDVAVTATVLNCTYERNQAQSGAAVYCATDSISAIDSCAFSSNGDVRTATGGAIAAYSHKQLNVTGTAFSNNNAADGAGVYIDRGAVIIQTSAFIRCNAARNGGAVWSSGTVTTAACTYSSNSASNNGGAVYTSVGRVTLIITDTSFTDNTAVNSGAAVFQFGTQWPLTAIATSVNFYNNSAGCCHATGYGSSSEWLSTRVVSNSSSSSARTTAHTCSDYDTGTGSQCCVLGEYSDGASCIRCTTLEDFSCTQVGATIGKCTLVTLQMCASMTALCFRMCYGET